MKRRHGLTLVFISHDLAVVKHVSDRVAVMFLGKLCEVADAASLYAGAPSHPVHPSATHGERHLVARVTRAAGATSLLPANDLETQSEMPSSITPPSGCRYRTRCPRAEGICAATEPVMREIKPHHYVACHFPIGAAVVSRGRVAQRCPKLEAALGRS